MTDIETAEVIEALRAMVKDPNLSVEYSPTLIVAARLLSRRDADRTAPAKEASVDERIGDRALDLWREYAEAGSHRVSEIEPRTLLKIVTELQSRRSSPVREGEGGALTSVEPTIAPFVVNDLLSALNDVVGEIFHLTKQGEDNIWRPVDRAVKRARAAITKANQEMMAQTGEQQRSGTTSSADLSREVRELIAAAEVYSSSVAAVKEVGDNMEAWHAAKKTEDGARKALCMAALASPSEPSGRGESGGIQGPASEASMNKEVT